MNKIAPRNVLLFHISQFLYATIFTIPIWIVYYQTKISLLEVSFLVAIQYASQLFLELPTGAFADLFSRKTSIIAGYLLWMVSSLVVLIAPGFWVIVLAVIIGGLAESLLSGSLEALLYDSHKQDGTEDKFSKALADNNILFQLGLILGTISGGFLYNIWFALPYILYAVFCLIAGLLCLFMIEPEIDSEKFTIANYFQQIKSGTKHAFHNRRTTLVSLYYIAVAGITWTVNLYFFDLALTQLFTSDQLRGMVGAGIRLINIIILATLVRNEKLFTRKVSIWFFPLLMTVGYLGAWYFFDQPYIPLLFLAIAVMCGTARWVILSKYTNECFESKYRATAISALSMLVGVIYIIITTVSGYIVNGENGVQPIFLLLGIISIIAIIPLARLNSKII
jgi:MFS family permease